MANTSVAITPGSGANIAINATGGLDYQVIKLDFGADGASLPAVADASGFLKVNLAALGAGLIFTVNNPTAANMKVDASGATVPISAASAIPVSALDTAPVFVRLSDGTSAVDTIPVSGTVAATQSGGWSFQITDGTHDAHLTLVGSNYALDVNVVSSVAIGGTALVDAAAFVGGTTPFTPVGAVYNDAIATPSTAHAAALRMTQNRGLHSNLRDATGAEIGTAASPIFVSPATSPNPQPVTGTVTADQGGAPWSVNLTELGGAAISETAPVPVYQAPTPHARISKTVTLAGGTTAGTVWSPTSGKRFYIKKLILVVSVSDTLDLFDAADSSGSILLSGTYPIGVFESNFDEPFISAAVNNVLKYTAGASLAAVITAHGWEE